MAVIFARLRMPVLWVAAALLIVGLVAKGFVDAGWTDVVYLVAVVLLVAGMAVYLRVGTVRAAPTDVASPVAGRWVALNSPANRVPSHGLHAYGQTYAIDVVHDPAERPRPGFGWWPIARPPEAFPAFGAPVRAPAGGVVVRVHDRERDHWSRNSWPALAYLLVEGTVRELLGPSRILGNHVVLDLGGGRFAALAHLQRRSVRVSVGDRVEVGQVLGACGNSGNSTEPHLHFQLMDHPRPVFAAGLPFRLRGYQTDDEQDRGVPRNGKPFLASTG